MVFLLQRKSLRIFWGLNSIANNFRTIKRKIAAHTRVTSRMKLVKLTLNLRWTSKVWCLLLYNISDFTFLFFHLMEIKNGLSDSFIRFISWLISLWTVKPVHYSLCLILILAESKIQFMVLRPLKPNTLIRTSF